MLGASLPENRKRAGLQNVMLA